jgi:hypothetical protein
MALFPADPLPAQYSADLPLVPLISLYLYVPVPAGPLMQAFL